MNFFNLLSELDLNKYTYIKNYKAGDIIFNAGSICDKIGLIVSGEASIITITHTEKEETISYLKQGDMFGDLLIFSSKSNFVLFFHNVLYNINNSIFFCVFYIQIFINFF